MDNRKFESGAAVGAPSAPGSPSSGYPTNGNPATGTPATVPGEFWFHAVGEELRKVIVDAGLTPAHADLTQLSAAITALARAANQSLYVSDTKTSGTHAGASSATTVHTRALNTVNHNSISGSSLASNKITLPAGTYEIFARAPALNVNLHAARLYNVTDAANVLLGSSENSTATATADGIQTWSVIQGRFTLAAAKDLEIRHYTNDAQASYGLGFAVAQASVSEVYTQVHIRRVG